MPKHPKVMKAFQEAGAKKLAYQIESEFMRDKKLHEVDEDLFLVLMKNTCYRYYRKR